MTCNCLTEIDKKLKEKNLSISTKCLALRMSGGVAISLPLDWVDPEKVPKGRKKSPPPIYISNCPFCGVLMREEEVNES